MTGKTEMAGMNYILATCHEDFTRFMQSLSRVRQNRGKERKTADRVGVKVFFGNGRQGGGKGIRCNC